MHLQDIIDELAKPEYDGLDDVQALSALKTSSEVVQGAVQKGDMLKYLSSKNLLSKVKTIANNDGHNMQNACEAILMSIIGGSQLDVHEPEVQLMLDGFIVHNVNGDNVPVGSGIIQPSQKLEILALGQTPKFANVTLKLVRLAMGLTNVQTVTDWAGGGFIKLTVSGELVEPLHATGIRYSDDLPKTPLGRYSEKTGDEGVYIIRLDNLRPLRGVESIGIELNASNSFIAELI